MHRLGIAISTVLLVALLAILLALRSESLVLAAAQWAVSSFTDLRLEWRNPRIDVYGGSLSAEEIHLIPRGVEGPALVSVLDVAVTTRLGDLLAANLLHSTLHAKQLFIYVSKQADATNPAPMQWLAYLGWLPEELRIEQAHLITVKTNTRVLPLKNVRGDRLERRHYQATADADYEGEPIGVVADLFALTRDGELRGADIKLVLNAPETGSELWLEGLLEGSINDFHYDFTLDANYTDITEFLKGFRAGANLAGALQVQGRMIGDSEGFVLSDTRFVLDNTPAYGFEAGGILEYSLSGESRIELIAAGELASLEYLAPWIDLDIGDLGTVQSSIKFSGSLDQPVIEQFRLNTRNEEGLTVSMSGKLDFYGAAPGTSPGKNSIDVDVQGPSLASLHHWLTPPAFDPGPWRASGRVTGDRHEVALSNLVLEIGKDNALAIRATGQVDSITRSADSGPATGNPQKYVIEQVDLLVEAQLPDSAELAELTGREIPALHKVSARFRLQGNSKQLALNDGNIVISGGVVRNDMDIKVRGHIGDIMSLSDVSLFGQFSGIDTRELLTSWLSKFQYADPVGTLAGSFKLDRQRNDWQLTDLIVQNTDPQDLLQIAIKGEVMDLAGLPTASMGARFEVADPLLLRALVGTPLRPVSGKLIIKTERGQVDASLSARIGDTQLKGGGSIVHKDQQIQHLKLALNIPHFHLGDLGLPYSSAQAQNRKQNNSPPGPQTPGTTEAEDWLEKLIARLPRYPVDFTVTVDGISGDNTSIDSLDIHLTGSDNRYTLERFTVVYDNALAEFKGIIDLNPNPPGASLGGRAVAIPVNSLARDLGMDTNVSGALTLLGGITITGTTPKQLLQNLNGSVAVALERAVIDGAAYDLLATDLLAWIYSGARNEQSTYLDCTMAKFKLTNGVASTDSLFVESSKMIATGEAEFDLVKQKMDVTIIPFSKSRKLQVASKVRLKGDMAKPKAVISPVAEAADASASVLMLIPNLTMKLFGVDSSTENKHRPCQAQGVSAAN